jgi:esterase/lipase
MEELKVLKERNSNIEVFKPLRKTVLLCTNGFQTTDTHDSLPMQEYFNNTFKEEVPLAEIALVKLFEPSDKTTHKTKYFEHQLEEMIQSYIAKDYDIFLMGYSFSAALVAKMAKKYQNNITRVIFVAPVYDTLINNAIPHYIKYAWKFHKLNKKYGKKVSKAIGRQTVQGLPGLLIAIFVSILQNRKYFRKVNQPTLLIRGQDDILCTSHALKKVNHKIKGESETYLYPKMTHGILKNVKLNGGVYEDIFHFCFDTSYILEQNFTIINKVKTAQPIKKVKLDEDGDEIPTFAEIFAQLDPEVDDRAQLQEDEF